MEPRPDQVMDLVRELVGSTWPAMDRLDDPVQGFAGSWSAGEVQVDLYLHALRVTPHGHPAHGGVQLHVQHAARAAAGDVVAVARLQGTVGEE